MVFKLSNTFADPASSTGLQQGFAPIGAGQQQTGKAQPMAAATNPGAPVRETKGVFAWLFPGSNASEQRGMPTPLGHPQMRPKGSMPNKPPVFGGVYQHYTPYYSRGAAAYVPNFGKVLENPIGAGIVVLQRPQASYGRAAEYFNGALWWTSQAIPTSINIQGLTDPAELQALLGDFTVEAMVRTTG